MPGTIEKSLALKTPSALVRFSAVPTVASSFAAKTEFIFGITISHLFFNEPFRPENV
jgi:hypothetical protein